MTGGDEMNGENKKNEGQPGNPDSSKEKEPSQWSPDILIGKEIGTEKL